MNRNDDPGATYAHGLAEEQGHLARLRRWLTWLVRGRIAVLVAGVVLAGEACSRHGHFGLAAAASAVVFVALTVAIALLEHRSKQHEAQIRYGEDGLARVQGHTIKDAPDGQRFADPAHPYATDLDIFGPASIFSHLCMARTGTGQAMVARFLTQAAPVSEIAGRQRAVAELSTRLPLRRDLWLAGGTVRERVREDALESWLSGAPTHVPRWQRLVTAALGALGLVVLYAFANPEAIPVAVAIVLVQRLWVRRYRTLTKSVEAQVFRRAYELRVIARSIARLAGERFSDPRLLALVAGLSDAGTPASCASVDMETLRGFPNLPAMVRAEQSSAAHHVTRLVRLVDWLESRRNQLFAIPAVVLLLPEQLCFAIESWRARHGASALRWLATLGEMEALASLATFAFEHPDFPFPQLVEQTNAPAFVATALGHPLIPSGVRVANDVRLDAGCRLLVVTGSNMSGKSTLLRTVGVNAVLAMAGAPVCAASLTLTPLQIGASLRAQDSLEAGVSRFFAEIKRLHLILSMATQKPPVLFLLDEILNGTNSQDRREGAEAILRQLLERGAVGLVTTHDLALSALADRPSNPGANVHFQDTLEGDRLLFDYRLQPGVVTRRNALDLMRLVGIDVSKS
jgi:hypothetical protein